MRSGTGGRQVQNIEPVQVFLPSTETNALMSCYTFVQTKQKEPARAEWKRPKISRGMHECVRAPCISESPGGFVKVFEYRREVS
jgi:hypothetical protein